MEVNVLFFALLFFILGHGWSEDGDSGINIIA